MLATAESMFGPGFVWLVVHNEPHATGSSKTLAILNTYLAGSPYAGAHWRKQSDDMNTIDNMAQPGEKAETYVARNKGQIATFGLQNSGRVIDRTGGKQVQAGAADIEPLLCVNVWPHVYLEQFGFAGKRKYLEKWWDSIDWSKVSRHVEHSSGLGHRARE